MKSLFGIVGLLVVLAVLAMVVKAQLKPAVSVQAGGASSPSPNAAPAQITQQVKDQVNAALQAAPKPDEGQ